MLKNLVIILLLTLSTVHPQTKSADAVRSVFYDIEKAVLNNDIQTLSGYFNSQTYVSLTNGTSGYYSSNQAFYVLKDFININRITSFKYTGINTDTDTPFATGSYNYEYRGRRVTSGFFITLSKVNKSWKITQISFN